MVLDERARWTSTLAIGQIRVTVVAAGRPPHKWHSGVHAQVNCCVDAAHDGPPAAGRTILEPADGQERNYASMAAALAADDSVGLFTLDAHGGEYRLRSLGEALIVEWGRAQNAEEARGFDEADLAEALAALRSLPRRLPLRSAARRAPTGPAGAIVDLGAARLARGR